MGTPGDPVRPQPTAIVGRADESALGQKLLIDAVGGRGGVVVVEGEAGVGKSRLVRAWVEAAPPGLEVVEVTCDELEREWPFGALIRAFGLDLGQAADGAARFAVADTIADMLEERSTGTPLVLVVEDLQWADPATVLALHRLTSRGSQTGLLLVMTRRPVPSSEELERLVAAVPRAGGTVLALGPLDNDEVTDLLTSLLGAAPGQRLLESVQTAAAGNPLFVSELAWAASADGRISISDGVADVEVSLPLASLHLAITEHLRFLSPATREILGVAAVLGSSFAAADLASVLEQPASSLAGPLGEARSTGVLVERGDRLGFRHDLVRDAVYQDHSASLRRALHVQAAKRLSGGAPAEVVAAHYRLGAEPGDEGAIEWISRAAAEVESRDPQVAAELLGHVLDLLVRGDGRRERLLAERARLHLWAGRFANAEQDALSALEGRPTDDVAFKARGVLVAALTQQGRTGDAAKQRSILEARPMDELDRRFVDVSFATVRLNSGDIQGALDDALTGIQAGERLGVPELVAIGSARACTAEFLRGNLRAAIDHGQRSLDVGAGPFRFMPLATSAGHQPLAAALIDADRVDEAGAVLHSRRRDDMRSGAGFGVLLTQSLLGVRGWVTGAWDDALAEIDTGMVLADELGTAAWRPTGAAVAMVIAAHRGDAARLSTMRKVLAADEKAGALQGWEWWITRWAAGVVAVLNGDLPTGLTQLREAWASASAVGSVAHHRQIGPDLARALIAAGETDEASGVAERLQVAADRAGDVPSATAAALVSRGLVAGDVNAVLEAVEVLGQSPRVFARMLATEDAGRLLGQQGDRERAVELLRQSRGGYLQLAASVDVRRVDASLREFGGQPGRRRTRERPTAGWDSITPTESEVVQLVCDGLTYRQVAERLYVSTRTVETHVAHVFQKLSVRSRAELTAKYESRPLGP